MDRGERIALLIEKISQQLESLLSSQARHRNSAGPAVEARESAQEPATPQTVQAEITVPESLAVAYQATQDQQLELARKSLRLQRWKFAMAFFGFAGAIAALVFAGMQFQQAAEQTRAMQRQIEAADRAWVVADTAISSPFTFNSEGAGMLSFDFTLRNVGRSVATGVTVHARMSVPAGEAVFSEPVERQKAMCEEAAAKNSTEGISLTLFPDETKRWSLGLLLRPEDIASGSIRRGDSEAAFIRPIVFGCVDYATQSSATRHQTGFIYTVGRFDATIDPRQILPIEVGAETPDLNLTLERYLFGGDYAN